MTTSQLLQPLRSLVTTLSNTVNKVLLGRFLVQLGRFGKTRKPKNCCVIFVGSPPHTQTTNTRHTPPTNNTQHHNHRTPLPITTNQPTKSTMPSHRVRLARLRPCCRLCAWVRPLGCIWATSASEQASKRASKRQRATVARQQLLRNVSNSTT